MRSEEEMFRLFERIAAEDDRIRVMTLEGSRVNPHINPDIWQDYDITFLVTDLESYMVSDEWLGIFGDLVFLQKPEAMTLFPPDFPEGWFSYLMLFRDGTKIDLTLIKLGQAEAYFASDPLIKVILDKDGIAPELPDQSAIDVVLLASFFCRDLVEIFLHLFDLVFREFLQKFVQQFLTCFVLRLLFLLLRGSLSLLRNVLFLGFVFPDDADLGVRILFPCLRFHLRFLSRSGRRSLLHLFRFGVDPLDVDPDALPVLDDSVITGVL